MDKCELRDARSEVLLICVKYEINCLILDAKSSGRQEHLNMDRYFSVFQYHPRGCQNIYKLWKCGVSLPIFKLLRFLPLKSRTPK